MPSPKMRRFFIYVCAVACLLMVVSCSSKNQPVDADGSVGPLPSSVASYDDIEIPPEMKMDTKKSMSITTESFRGGMLSFSGSIEITSLRDYIISTMKNNQWRHVGEASYDNVLLAFTKPNKTCMVVLEEGFGGSLGKTYLEMYITVDVAASNSLNPFGEPVTK